VRKIQNILSGLKLSLALFVVRNLFGEYKTRITRKQLQRGEATILLIRFAGFITLRLVILGGNASRIVIPSRLRNGISIVITNSKIEMRGGTINQGVSHD